MDDQGLDDLFGDQLNEPLNEEQIQQHLDVGAPVPPPPGLLEQIDSLRLGGCNDKIAWSRAGSIAYVTKDQKDVRLCTLRCQSETGEWIKNAHTDNHFTHHLRAAFKLRSLAHLSWNPTALDLLVADVCGRIVLFTTLIAINRPTSTKIMAWDQDDSLNALVGLMWINQKRQVRLSRGSVKTDGQWRHMIGALDPKGIYYPPSIPPGGNKSAFIAVTRRSKILMGYQPPQHQGYTDIKYNLEGFTTAADALTHAALSPYKDDNILLAAHNESKKVKLYSLKIDWKQANPSQPPSAPPALSSQHLTTIDFCSPRTDSHWSLPPPELVGLELIPHSYFEKNALVHPTVLAIFVEHDSTNNGLPTRTFLSRWALKEEKPAIDSSFSQLSTKRAGSNELKPELALESLEDLRIDRVVLHMQMQQYNETWAIFSSDGMVEFRDRHFEILSMDESPDKTSSLPQLGFSLTNQKPCLHVALSPNGVVKVYMGKEHDLEIAVMQLPVEMVDLGTIATMEKIAVAFVVVNAVAESAPAGTCTNDDIVMTMSRFMSQLSDEQRTFLHDLFLRETYKILGLEDKLTDVALLDRTIRLGVMARCHSMQAALGNRGEILNRTIPSKLALMALHLKTITIAFTMAVYSTPKPAQNNMQGAQSNQASRPEPGADSDLNRADVLQYITNLTAWYMKLTDYVIDQLFELNRILDVTDGEIDVDVLRLRIFASNSPAIPLLLSTFTRNLFRRSFHGLRILASCTAKPYAHWPSPTTASWEGFRKTLHTPSVPPPLADNLLSELDERCKKDFADAGLTDAQRHEHELDLIIRGVVPDVLVPTAGWLLSHGVEKLRSGTAAGGHTNLLPAPAEADLAFADWSILGVTDDVRSKRWRRQVLFDGVQKKVLGKRSSLRAHPRDNPLRVRSCTRCGISMEDQMPPKNKDVKYPPLFHSFRICICGAHFVTERLEDLAGREERSNGG